MGVMDDRWYKHGLIYEVSVPTFFDSNDDGIGDLRGLAYKLDYLAGLGVTTLWLLPFYPSPWRDDGYDVTDYYGVHPDMGTPGDFVELVHEAGERGMRVMIDLVLNHTSDEHPWFQAARDGHPKYRDYYVWANRRPRDAEKGVVFPGVQKTTWSFDRKARRYYFHRFYDFQPDLNIANPEVREEMARIMGFWTELGIAGFRIDAAPFLIEPAGAAGIEPGPRFDYLHQLRNHMSWRRGSAILLGEANVERDEVQQYFGEGGMHMLFNFEANRGAWLAMARGDARPLVESLDRTVGIPESDQWANFLRNHDEIDLGRLSDEERQEVFDAFGPDPSMQLYDRGIRRRVAPMLGGDRRRLELAYSLLLSLPGTPVLYYGDEIGMGDDLSLPEREPVRTPMQWSRARNAGFSRAPGKRLPRSVISSGPFAYRQVNVADQQRDDRSLLRWLEAAVRVRRRCTEVGQGPWEALATGSHAVLGLRYRGPATTLVTLHNLGPTPARARLRDPIDGMTEELADQPHDRPAGRSIELEGFGYRWLRGTGSVTN